MMFIKERSIIIIVIMVLSFTFNIAESAEIDVVGCDASCFFLDSTGQNIIINQLDIVGRRINNYSDFPYNHETQWGEYFTTSAGILFPDPCFGSDRRSYSAAYTSAYNESFYEWNIVLQMKPEKDLYLKITNCVLNHNEIDPYESSSQTGYYIAPTGQSLFIFTSNPLITVTAHPGPYATPYFDTPFHLESRMLPSVEEMEEVALKDTRFTAIALFNDSIVLKRPENGDINSLGEDIYTLKAGDQIRIRIDIPHNNTTDIWYGKDNIRIEYVGIHGTEFISEGLPCRRRFFPIRPVLP